MSLEDERKNDYIRALPCACCGKTCAIELVLEPERQHAGLIYVDCAEGYRDFFVTHVQPIEVWFACNRVIHSFISQVQKRSSPIALSVLMRRWLDKLPE